jgi:hypothetical protein
MTRCTKCTLTRFIVTFNHPATEMKNCRPSRNNFQSVGRNLSKMLVLLWFLFARHVLAGGAAWRNADFVKIENVDMDDWTSGNVETLKHVRLETQGPVL